MNELFYIVALISTVSFWIFLFLCFVSIIIDDTEKEEVMFYGAVTCSFLTMGSLWLSMLLKG